MTTFPHLPLRPREGHVSCSLIHLGDPFIILFGVSAGIIKTSTISLNSVARSQRSSSSISVQLLNRYLPLDFTFALLFSGSCISEVSGHHLTIVLITLAYLREQLWPLPFHSSFVPFKRFCFPSWPRYSATTEGHKKSSHSTLYLKL